MQIETTEFGQFKLTDIFNQLVLFTKEDNSLRIYARDWGFEIGMSGSNKVWRADFEKGVIEEMGCNQ